MHLKVSDNIIKNTGFLKPKDANCF